MEKDNFKSKIGVIAATGGSAVGLGNIWAFSFKAGTNGGGTFVLIYLLCVIFIGVPVMLAEFIVGREGRGGPVGSIENVASKKSFFKIGGYIGSLTTFLILSFYSVIAGWSLNYLVKTIPNGFSQFLNKDSSKIFGDTVSNVGVSFLYQIVFMFLTALIVMYGIKNGIEKLSKIMMPMLGVIIIIMVIYSTTLSGFTDAVKFLFLPHGIPKDKNMYTLVATAMGHAFFTLSLGMGAIITYARAVDDDLNINTVTIQVAVMDTSIALLSGLAIFPIIFSTEGLKPDGGPGLAFMSLPVAFAKMPGGYIIGNLFFILLFVAALSSSISMLENTLITVIEKTKLNRKIGVFVLAAITTAFGLLSQLGLNFHMPVLNFVGNDTDFLDQLSLFTSNYTIPIGALFIIILVGWRMKPQVVRKQIKNKKIANIFIVYIKFIAPILVALIFIGSVFGIIQN